MSGGSWDYVYFKVEETAERLRRDTDPLRRAFGSKLVKAADALRLIEGVDSGDWSKANEVEAIKLAIGLDAAALTLEEARLAAQKSLEDLKEALKASAV